MFFNAERNKVSYLGKGEQIILPSIILLQEGGGVYELISGKPNETVLGILLITLTVTFGVTIRALLASFERRENALIKSLDQYIQAFIELKKLKG